MRRRTLLAGVGTAAAAAWTPVRRSWAGAVETVKQRGVLKVGVEAAYVPYEFVKEGRIVGYDPDIAGRIGQKLGVRAEFIDTAWNGIIPALYAGKFDCIVSAMTITAERAEKVLFSMPYADASNVVLLRGREDRIKTAEDLSGRAVGVQLGSAAANIAKVFDAKLKAQGKPGFTEVKQYEHYPEAYQDLLNKRTDAVINSHSSVMVMMRDAPGRFKTITGISDISAYFGMAFRKDDAALRDFFNAQLGQMKQDGTLGKLQQTWFGGATETPDSIPNVLPS